VSNPPTKPTTNEMIGNPHLLGRLREWAGPMPESDLLAVQAESGRRAEGTGYVPLYRVEVQ
jgi:hypothetical protein